MTDERRKTIMTIIAPAFAVLAIYNWFYLGSVTKASADAQKAYDSAVGSEPTPIEIHMANQKLRQKRLEQAETDKKIKELEQKLKDLSKQISGPKDQPFAIKQVGRLLTKHGLYITHENRLDSKQSSALSPCLTKVCQTLAQFQDDEKKNVEHIIIQYEFIGPYTKVQEVLENWNKEEHGSAIPVSLQMLPANPRIEHRRWVLNVRF